MTDPSRPEHDQLVDADAATLVTVVVDRSGSMEPLAGAVVEGINELIRSLDADARVTIVQFDSDDPYEVIVDDTPAGTVPRVAYDQYEPRGGTPLYDAVGIAISRTAGRAREIEILDGGTPQVVLAIVTDGYENASREYTGPQIARLIERNQSEGWTVTYVGLGLGAAAFTEAQAMGIDASSVLSLRADLEGTSAAFLGISAVTNQARARRYRRPSSPS